MRKTTIIDGYKVGYYYSDDAFGGHYCVIGIKENRSFFGIHYWWCVYSGDCWDKPHHIKHATPEELFEWYSKNVSNYNTKMKKQADLETRFKNFSKCKFE